MIKVKSVCVKFVTSIMIIFFEESCLVQIKITLLFDISKNKETSFYLEIWPLLFQIITMKKQLHVTLCKVLNCESF